MTPERWHRVEAVLRRVLECAPSARSAVVAEACGGDAALVREVESLLANHDTTGSFLREPLLAPGSGGESRGNGGVDGELQRSDQLAAPVPDANAADALLGASIDGKYRIEALLGRGGMGAVYRATQLQLERPVAIKLLRNHQLGAGAALARFRREALAVARLKHPHIVAVYDFGLASEVGAYIVMEYVEGRSLRQELDEHARLPLSLVRELMRQVCSAVQAAHAAGIVHRDLKPDNIMLERAAGRVAAKVLDFGIARLQDLSTLTTPELTMNGALMGTPAYMSPEQCRGEEADARSDVYALGCVLYEMLTGRPPFEGTSMASLLYKHINAAPRPPREVVGEVAPELEAALMRALAKAPAERPQTVEAFGRALGVSGDAGGAATGGPGASTGAGEARTTAREGAGAGKKLVPHNLPQAVTRFVGRDVQIRQVREWLERARLVTLVGPGGIGKTRLALEVARAVLEAYAGGVWLVELAPLRDPALVVQAVAAVLGVKEESGRTLEASVAAWLEGKQVLLVLDNCEHLVEACAGVTQRLLAGSRGLRVVATSREALGVGGEAVWAVPALDVGAPGAAGPEEALSSEAARLFVDRAALVRPGFAASEANAPAIAALCRRLEGIPLALELAAARVKVLSVEQMLEKMNDRFRLLTGGSRTAPSRQQTLRAAIDWSYELLTEAERVLLRRLSVFAGGWSLHAADAVCGEGGGRRQEAGGNDPGLLPPPFSLLPSEVLDVLARLVDKSFVIVEERTGETRYRMLETLRAYAAEKLSETREEPLLLERHRVWFVQLAERGESELSGPEQGIWLARLEAEHDNLRAVLRRAVVAAGADETGLRLCAALGRFWYRRGYWSEGIEWAEAALAQCTTTITVARGRALYSLGLLKNFSSDFEGARSFLNEAEALQRTLGDRGGLCQTLYTLASATTIAGDHDRATALAEECVALARENGDRHMTAMGGSMLGWIASRRGELDRARRFFQQSLALCREQGNTRDVCLVLFNLGHVAVEQGDLERAVEFLNESADIARKLGDKTMLAGSSAMLGIAALERGDHQQALSLLRESLVLVQELKMGADIASVLEGLAQTAVAQGDARRALCLAGAAAQLRETIGVKRTDQDQSSHDAHMKKAREGLSAEVAERAFADGYEMPLERAVEYALGMR